MTVAFLLGLLPRLGGLLFDGMLDMDQNIFVWGSDVRMNGLAAAFGADYGVLSYVLFGWFYALAELMPRFWWLPHKLAEILFELGVAGLLWRLAPPDCGRTAFLFYWLNPWFILHGAWQGFWEGPHIVFGLLGVLLFKGRAATPVTWLAFGVLVMTAAMFKPQGLLYFVLPMGLYLFLDFLRFRSLQVFWFGLGVASVFLMASLSLFALGAGPMAVLNNYVGVPGFMPNLCNDCINVWRPVTLFLQGQLGQSGPTFALVLPATLQVALHAASAILVACTLLAAFWMLPWSAPAKAVHATDEPPQRMEPALGLLTVLALSSLVISQLGTRAHINHTYTALVLLIPLVVRAWPLMVAWAVMCAVELYAHLGVYQLGREVVLPQYLPNPATSAGLVSGIEAATARPGPDALLAWQAAANAWLSRTLPGEPLISVLALLHVLCAVYCLVYVLGRRDALGR